ncbi:MAG: NAD(P)-dependent glycerol-3-phosphate dehydrogenase [Solobacterium sp.]|nr:NAD(P)-dependent glycerol-3-phosphate dehydrogenase [Solobacterium sp.]
MKTAVLGTGSWGTALAQVLADNGTEVICYGIDEHQVNDINENHANSTFFNAPVNPAVHATMDLSEALKGSDIVLLGVPSTIIPSLLNQMAELLDHPVIVINVAKGFHPTTHERLSVVIEHSLPEAYRTAVVSLIGPSHAEEVIIRKLTVVNAVSDNEEAARIVQELFSNDYFRVYTNHDVAGAEVGVAVKNIMAIAAGALEGIGQGDNARAALITRGLAELTRFGTALGGKKETYLGLDGVGDLIVTCTSRHSRNFMAGFEIGKAGSAEEFLRTNTRTVEGISACRIVHEEAQKRGISMPITDEVYAVLFEGKSPQKAIIDLMRRDLKQEGN